MNDEYIINEVKAAFKNHPYPGDENLCLRRENFPNYEGNKIFDLFKQKHWEEITEEYLEDNYNKGLINYIPPFLTKDAFIYYLPAFITIIVKNYSHWQDFAQSLCFYIEPKEDNKLFSMTLLSDKEEKALKIFLDYLVRKFGPHNIQVNPAFRIMEAYWK